MADTTTRTSSCHCRATTYTFTVPTSSLPLKAYLCHCNISRRISGCLCTSYVPIPSTNPPPDLTPLTGYRSSSILTRHFCTTCGTQMFLEYAADGHFEAATGTLDRSDGVVRFHGHMWIEDSRDGGPSVWIPRIGGRQAERWLVAPHESPQVPLDWRDTADDPAPTTATAEAGGGSEVEEAKLPAHCHCAGVRFCITRPDDASRKASSPFPDVLVPYHSSTSSSANPNNETWWLSPTTPRYTAGTCACTSCRTSSGFEISAWAFVPTANVSLSNGDPFPESRSFGTLKAYRSSPGVTRRFCGVCGATVFWDGDKRPSVMDVAVGVLDAPSGARAEEWLEWVTGRVSFREDALCEDVIGGLEAGLKVWGQGGGGKMGGK